MIEPRRWDDDQLQRDRLEAIGIFRRERLDEPLEEYLEVFDSYQGVFEELLETTVDLTRLRAEGLTVLGNKRMLEAVRYLAGPPISKDDLRTIAEASSLSKRRLADDPQLVETIVSLVLVALDRRRFPWLTEEREPTEAETNAAVLASATLIAAQRVSTSRRSQGKKAQEQLVEDALTNAHFRAVPRRPVKSLARAPRPGEFCRESVLGTSKADFILGLWDDRIMPIECKVSNSALNSVKRLNRDAAAKAEAWRRDFGETQVIPTAVLSGVFHLEKLHEAQRRGLSLFWAHRIEELVKWIEETR